MAPAIKPRQCLVPGCRNSMRTRGLCHTHYQTCRAMCRKGTADEDDLVRRGLMLPEGVPGGSPVAKGSHECFVQGSKVRGDG